MSSARKQIIELVENECIPEKNIDAALQIVKVRPSENAWFSFLNLVFLWIGGIALATSVIFFIAYNWEALGDFIKFGMVQLLIVLAIGIYWKLESEKILSKVALFVATILLGVLLALFGQTYQTGADPWQLFFNWALLMIPWAMVARFPALWILWLALINLSIVLYFQAFGSALHVLFNSNQDMLWILFLFNILAQSLWELFASRMHWLNERWAIRILGVASGAMLTSLVIMGLFSGRNENLFPTIIWFCWIISMYLFYRIKNLDLFMLAGSCLSGIIVIVSFIIKAMERGNWDAGNFLFLMIVVVALGAGSAFWLKKVNQEDVAE